MDYWWKDKDREKSNWLGKNLSQCHFVYHKSHRDWPGTEMGHYGEKL